MNKHTVFAACVAAAALVTLTGCGAGKKPAVTAQPATTSSASSTSAASSATPSAPSRPAGFPGALFYTPAPGDDAKWALEKLSGEQVIGLIAAGRTSDAMVSPDGSRIAFVESSTLRVTDSSGANERNLGTGFMGVGFEPAWSKAGDQLLATKRVEGGTTLGIVTVATGAFAPLRHNPDGIHHRWSADGKHIAYATGTCEIGVADADGGNARLIKGVVSCDPFSISPDGTKLAVDVIHPGDEYGDIGPNRRADAIIDTTTGKTVTIPVAGTVTQVIFRPDGRTLVRSSNAGTFTLTLLGPDNAVIAKITEPAAVGKASLVAYV